MLTPPLHLVWQRELPPPASLLAPRTPAIDAEGRRGADLVLLYRSGRIEALEARSGAVRWSVPVNAAGGAPVLLTGRRDILLFTSIFQCWALDAGSGQTRWSFGQVPPEAGSPGIDPEVLGGIIQPVLGGGTLVVFSADGSVAGLRIDDGRLLWRQSASGKLEGSAAVNHEYVAYVSRPGGRTTFVVLDAASGKQIGRFTSDVERQINWLGFSPERVLVAAGSDAIIAYRPQTGALLWRAMVPAGVRAASIQMGPRELYFGTEDGGLLALSLLNGRTRWQVLPLEPGAAINRTWLDRGALYTQGAGGLQARDAGSGRLPWSAAIPAGSPAFLTAESFVVVGGLEPADPPAPPALRAWFIDRHSGLLIPEAARAEARGSLTARSSLESPGSSGPGLEAELLDALLVVRQGGVLCAWAP